MQLVVASSPESSASNDCGSIGTDLYSGVPFEVRGEGSSPLQDSAAASTWMARTARAGKWRSMYSDATFGGRFANDSERLHRGHGPARFDEVRLFSYKITKPSDCSKDCDAVGGHQAVERLSASIHWNEEPFIRSASASSKATESVNAAVDGLDVAFESLMTVQDAGLSKADLPGAVPTEAARLDGSDQSSADADAFGMGSSRHVERDDSSSAFSDVSNTGDTEATTVRDD